MQSQSRRVRRARVARRFGLGRVWFGVAILCAMAVGAGEAADRMAPSAAVAGFDRFVTESTPVCLQQPASRCVDAGWRYADTDRDRGLTLGELRAVRDTLAEWTQWRGDGVTRGERMAIGLGLWIVDSVGLEALMKGYDGNGDGRLSRDELLTDVRLDDRPLGKILLDPSAVDRAAVAKRLGSLAPVLDGYLRRQ